MIKKRITDDASPTYNMSSVVHHTERFRRVIANDQLP